MPESINDSSKQLLFLYVWPLHAPGLHSTTTTKPEMILSDRIFFIIIMKKPSSPLLSIESIPLRNCGHGTRLHLNKTPWMSPTEL